MVKIPANIITHEALENIGRAMSDATGTKLRKRWSSFTGNEAVICDMLLEATEGVLPLLPSSETLPRPDSDSGHYKTELAIWRKWAGDPAPMFNSPSEQPYTLDDYWNVQNRCRVLAMLYEWHLLPDSPSSL